MSVTRTPGSQSRYGDSLRLSAGYRQSQRRPMARLWPPPPERARQRRGSPIATREHALAPLLPRTPQLSAAQQERYCGMFKASTPLLCALMARWNGKIDAQVADSRRWQIQSGRFRMGKYGNPRFLNLPDKTLSRAGSFQRLGRNR